MRRRLIPSPLPLLAAVALVMAACGPAEEPDVEPDAEEEEPAAEPDAEGIRVAVIFPGLVDDESWNQIGHDGMRRAEEEFGAEVAFSEQVSPAQAEEAFRDFAARGFDLVIGHGGEFEDQALVIADEFPDTTFVVINGGSDNDVNYAAYRAAAQEWTFMDGVLAGMLTENDFVSYVVGLCFPAIAVWVNGARQGVEHVNPDARFDATFTGDFEDSALALETADTLISEGVDVIMTTLDEGFLGVVEAARGTDTRLILEHYDHRELAPDNIVTSKITPYGDLMYMAIRDVATGSFQPELVELHLNEMDEPITHTAMADWVPEDVRAEYEATLESLLAGEIEVEADSEC